MATDSKLMREPCSPKGNPPPGSLNSRRAEANGRSDPYRELFAIHPQPLWVVDRETLGFLAVNEAAVCFFSDSGKGAPEDGQPPEDLVNLARAHAQTVDLKAGTTPFPAVTLRYQRKDGTVTVVEVKVQPTFFEGRDAILGVAHDITERQRAEEPARASERCFQALVENSSDVVMLMDQSGTILYDAPCPGHILGYGDENFVGRDAFEYVHPEDLANVQKDLAELGTRPGGTATTQFRARHQDGTWRWLDAVGTNLLEEASVRAIVMSYRDVTERKNVEEALRQSQQHFEALVNSIEGIVWEADFPTLQYTFVSRPAERLLGYPLERWLAEPTFWKDHLDPRDRDWTVALCLQSLAAGQTHDFEYRMLAANGRVVWLRDLVTVVCANGRPAKLRGVMFDVTRRKQAEEKLRESEERHRLITELTSDYSYTVSVNPDGAFRLESATEGFIRITGYSLAELQRPGHETDFIHPEDLDVVRERGRLWRAGGRDVGELRFRRKDGQIRWIRYSVQPIQEPGSGRVTHLLGAGQDITERKRTEETLKRLAHQNELILSAAGEGIYGIDRQGWTTFVNPAAARMFGWLPQEMIGKSQHALIHHHRPDGTAYPDEECPIYTSLKDGTVRKMADDIFWRKDGTFFPVEYISNPIWEEGVLVGAVVTFNDISERKRAEEKLREAAERLRLLSAQLLAVQELERRHLAAELHDEVGQILTGLHLSLAMSARVGGEALRAGAEEAQATIKDLTARVRDISLRLRPTMLDDLGLLPALLWHFERYTSQTGVDVLFEHEGLERRLHPPEVETAAYRIVQEALTNVARHAGVGEVMVRIWLDSDLLCIQVQDDGAGFEPQAVLAAGASSGLSGMQERAALLGGYVGVDSGPGAGTRVTAELPVAGAQERRRANVFEPFPGGRSSDSPARVESNFDDDSGHSADR